jgi:tetratricopeptide (TPR) repeat protein
VDKEGITMELTLTRQDKTQVLVTCDGQPSHTFDLRTLLPNAQNEPPQPLEDPVKYGKAAYRALFAPETLAQRTLDTTPERILLITTDNDLDAIPWEYTHGPDGFIVQDYPFVRGLPADQRIDPPALDTGLHIVAVPSNPLDKQILPLNIDGEWQRLKEIIQDVPFAITLERTRPPTLEQVRRLLANQRNRVVHFMGHGGQHETGAVLLFENDYGDLHPVTAKDFMRRVRGSAFLVALNACVSATPGPTAFSNLASALVQQKIPYALGMRFSIVDEDARAFSRTFYSELARGISVEEALLQVRLALAESPRRWAIGVPVLYTALKSPAAGFSSIAGTPTINEHQPRIEATALPRAEGAFQGRIEELKQLGTWLTTDPRKRIITIHGAGGQGKTALAREAIERFAYAWPGGAWAISLENLPGREVFVTDLARFLGISTQEITDSAEMERQVLDRLKQRRLLIVLDNAETLAEAVEANNEEARRLAQFIREQLPNPPVSLLATSRAYLGWPGEIGFERDLKGLAPEDGARLFWQSAPQRAGEIDLAAAEKLSQKVEGHPLSLRLLGGTFNEITLPLQAFIQQCETYLMQAENKYASLDHRHRTLYACIDTSVRYLDTDLRSLLGGLWVFHAPFLPQTAVTIFDPDTESEHSPIYDRLQTLWQRGLLTRETVTLREGTFRFYRLLPTMRPYVEQYLAQTDVRETLLARFGSAYAQLVRYLHRELDRGSVAASIALQLREDLERGKSCVTGLAQAYYLLSWGWILQRLGARQQSLGLTEQALEIAQGQDRTLEAQALHNLAGVYQSISRPQEALRLFEQALPIQREVGDRAGEAATLSNWAGVYQNTGRPQEALRLFEQALLIQREVGDRAGEATTSSDLALVYERIGRPQEALRLFEQALLIRREVGDRAGEATTSSKLANVYQNTGRSQEALRLYEQALPILREVGDRAGEAATLSNLAGVYLDLGRLQEALRLYEQTLPIHREVGNRAGEAATLSNLSLMYQRIGRSQEALRLYEQALPILREVGDRASEAATLNGLAYLYQSLRNYTEALTAFEQSIRLARQTSYHAAEIAGLVGLARLLYQYLHRPQEAITHLEQAISVFQATGLPQDAAGQTAEDLHHLLQRMRTGVPLGGQTGGSSTMPAAQIQQIITNTVAVMTVVQDRRAEWREAIAGALQEAQQQRADWQFERDFFTAILAILNGQAPALPEDHPYAQAVEAILAGIAAPQEDEPDDLPFDAELIPRSIGALLGGPQKKMAHVQYLTEQAARATDEGLKAFINTIQLALFGSDLSRLGQNLSGIYKQAWEAIVLGVKTEGVDPQLFEQIVHNTSVVLGPAADKRGEWRDNLTQIRSQAIDTGAQQLVALVDAVIGLLDAGGNPTGLGTGLTGIYAKTWQKIVQGLS